MPPRILISVGALAFGVLVPLIEIDATHVFNPDWPPHARLHEVWQLLTNSALAVACLWWVWKDNRIRLAALVGAIVTGGFLVAFLIRGGYGGSMLLTSEVERTVFGLNLGVLVFSTVFLGFLLAAALSRRQG